MFVQLSARWRTSASTLVALAIALRPTLLGGEQPGNATPSRPTQSQPTQSRISGVLVLLNGNLMEGKIERRGDVYFVSHQTATLQIPAQQVEMFCGSASEAYEVRRRRFPSPTADSHAELAQWCLANRMWREAQGEIVALKRLDPQHADLARLAAQLEQAVHTFNRLEKAGPIERQGTQPMGSSTGRYERLDSESGADVSPPVRRQFVRSIQPMLIATCAVAGCHRPDSAQKFQLNRLAKVGRGNAALGNENLLQTLSYVDRLAPEASPLLEYGRQAHGPSDHPSTVVRPHQLALLREWIALIADPEPPTLDAASAELPPPNAPSTRAVNSNEVSGESDDLPAQRESLPLRKSRIMASASASDDGSAHARSPRKPWAARDKFDPEIFHRRQAARSLTAPPQDRPSHGFSASERTESIVR